MKTFVTVLFALLAVSQALHHVGLERHNHLKEKFAKAAHQKSKSASGLAYVNLEGGIETTGEYYATIYLGSDKQTFTVQVDTGSSVLAVPAKGCVEYTSSGSTITPTTTTCPHAHSLYDSSKSSDSSSVPYTGTCNQWDSDTTYCEFILQYGDGSFLVGTLENDLLTMGGVSATVKFGMVEGESTGFAQTGIDGIMGMAYQALDPYSGDDVFGVLVTDGQVSNSFSMCLSEDGGVMVLGGVDTSYNAGSMQYTPIVDETYYVVGITDMKVGTTSLGSVSYGNSIVDSGTTLFYLATNAFNSMVSIFQNTVCPTLSTGIQADCTGTNNIFTSGSCYALSDSDVASFPDITISLTGISALTMSPQDYFISQVDSGTTYYCFAIMDGGSDTIMGDIFMQNYNIHFDRANVQVGFAPVQNCTQLDTGSATSVSFSVVAVFACVLFALLF